MNSTRKAVIVCLAGYSALLLLIVYGYINGRLSVKTAGVELIVLVAIAVVIFTIVLTRLRKRANPTENDYTSSIDARESRAIRKTIRNYKVAIVVMLLILVDGVWNSKGLPLWVTVVGASINIGIICVLVRIVRTKTAEISRRSPPQNQI